MNSQVAGLFDLSGKNALVIGATGALGGIAAKALSGAGAHVTIVGGNSAKLDTVEAEITNAGGSVRKIVARPDSEQACDTIVARATEYGHSLDILVSASGMAKIKPALELEPSEWDAVMDANVRQSWLIARACGRAMIGSGNGGKILFVSSVRGRFATRAGTTAYAPSKSAVDMLTKSFATEWGQHNINVNAIAPTVFRSELTEWLFAPEATEQRNSILSRLPIGRLAEPSDLAGPVIFLCSHASDYVTGEILDVDGGFSAN